MVITNQDETAGWRKALRESKRGRELNVGIDLIEGGGFTVDPHEFCCKPSNFCGTRFRRRASATRDDESNRDENLHRAVFRSWRSAVGFVRLTDLASAARTRIADLSLRALAPAGAQQE
jgi:hypothetical protein